MLMLSFKFRPGCYIAAISGGVDSMVLLDILSQQPDLKLIVAHFDHGIRKDSAEDARFVSEVAYAKGIKHISERVELGPQASEASARQARYDFLKRVKARYNAKAIITAHHEDDVLETTIVNLLRGTGWRGIASLNSSKDIVRPMLHVAKADVIQYAQDHNLLWREDSTNSDTRYLRNRIRLQILPLMNTRDKSAVADLLRLSQEQRALRIEVERNINKIVSELVREAPGELRIKRADIVRLPSQVCMEVLRAVGVRASGAALERQMLRRMRFFACCARPGKQMEITKNLTMRVSGDSVIVYNR